MGIGQQEQTLGSFWSAVGTKLSDRAGVDRALVDVIAKHLLTPTPGKDAVAQAKDAILDLARERATSPKAEGG
jgi:hypothetical protein